MTHSITRRAAMRGMASAAFAAILAACSGGQATDTPRPAASLSPDPIVPTPAAPPSPVAAAPTARPTDAPPPPMAAATPPATTAASMNPAPTSAPPMSTARPIAPSASLPMSGAQATAAVSLPPGVAAPTDLMGRLTISRLTVALPSTADTKAALADNADLLAYIKQAFGVDIVGVVSPSPFATTEALRMRMVDVAFLDPFAYLYAKNGGFAQSLVQGEQPDGKVATNVTVLIGLAEGGPVTPFDLRGKTVAFVDTDYVMGRVVPAYLLRAHPQLAEGTDYTVLPMPTYADAYQAVLAKKADAAAFPGAVYSRGMEVDLKRVKILDQSEPFPGGLIAARGDLPQSDRDALTALFLTLNEQPRGASLYLNTVVSPPKGKGSFGGDTVKLRAAADSAYDGLRELPGGLGVDLKALVR